MSCWTATKWRKADRLVCTTRMADFSMTAAAHISHAECLELVAGCRRYAPVPAVNDLSQRPRKLTLFLRADRIKKALRLFTLERSAIWSELITTSLAML